MRHLFRLLTAMSVTLILASTGKAGFDAPMTVVEVNGFQLTGAEYWPFVSNEPFRYPGDVLWGFYPEAASPDSVSCAEQSHRALIAFFRDNWQLMQSVVARGATRKFYLWTNDYTAASPDRELRTTRMWHWNSGARDYTSGYWKWETTLTQNSICLVPQAAQIREELKEALRVLLRN